MDNLDQYLKTDVDNNEQQQSGVRALSDFGRSLVYSAVEAPINGVSQLADMAVEPLTGAKLWKADFTGLQKDLEQGNCNETAVQAGTAIGGMVPFFIANKCAGKLFGRSVGAAKLSEAAGFMPSKLDMAKSIAQGAATGAFVGGILTPTRENENAVTARLENAFIGGAGGGIFQGANDLSRAALGRKGYLHSLSIKDFITKDIPLSAASGAVSGAGTGFINAHLTSLVKEHRLATSGEVQHSMISEALMGGAFNTVHSTVMRFAKPAQLTDAQKSALVLKELDQNDVSFKELMEASIPPPELESIDSIHATMANSKNPIAYADMMESPPVEPLRWLPGASLNKLRSYRRARESAVEARRAEAWQLYASGESLVSGELHVAHGPNEKPLAFSFTERYAAREFARNDKPILMLGYFGVHPQLQSAGMGKHYLNDMLIPSLKQNNPEHVGLAVEAEAYRGLPADSQPQQRARFYRDKAEMVELEIDHSLPPFLEGEAEGMWLDSYKKYAHEKGLPQPEDPIPARLLWKSFTGEPITGMNGRSMQERIFHSGYGYDPNDPFVVNSIMSIDGSAASLERPMDLSPAPSDSSISGRLRAIKSQATRSSVNALDGNGTAIGIPAVVERDLEE